MTAAHVTFTSTPQPPPQDYARPYKSVYRVFINVSTEVVVKGWAVTLAGHNGTHNSVNGTTVDGTSLYSE
jgi:endonuclease YncB( thermonuclease family)